MQVVNDRTRRGQVTVEIADAGADRRWDDCLVAFCDRLQRDFVDRRVDVEKRAVQRLPRIGRSSPLGRYARASAKYSRCEYYRARTR